MRPHRRTIVAWPSRINARLNVLCVLAVTNMTIVLYVTVTMSGGKGVRLETWPKERFGKNNRGKGSELRLVEWMQNLWLTAKNFLQNLLP